MKVKKMKTVRSATVRSTTRLIAIAAIITLVMAACSPGGPPPIDPIDPPPGTAFSVSGSFEKVSGDTVQFNLADTASLNRSITSESYAVSGQLEDGDIIFRLSGTYDPLTRSYTASSSSSLIRYSINGAFSTSGQSLGSTATLLVREGIGSDTWTAYSYVIEEADAVVITGTESTDVIDGGIPTFARGWWNFSDSSEGYSWEANVLLSEWTINQDVIETDPEGKKDIKSFSASVVEVEQAGSSVYNIILGLPVFIANQMQAEAAAAAFLTQQGLTATKLDAPPYSGLYDGYYWYVEEVNGLPMYGGSLPEEWTNDGGGSGPFLNFISQFQTNFSAENDRHPTKDEFAAAIRAYIEEFVTNYGKHIEVLELDGPPETPEMPNTLWYWYNEEENNIHFGYPMDFATPQQWDKVMLWYTTNYLERYLITAGVTPQTRYTRSRITFSSNNTSMTVVDYFKTVDSGPFGEYREFMFNTVSEARTLTEFEQEFAITITR